MLIFYLFAFLNEIHEKNDKFIFQSIILSVEYWWYSSQILVKKIGKKIRDRIRNIVIKVSRIEDVESSLGSHV